MRRTVLAMAVLVSGGLASGCMIESAQGPAARHLPMAEGAPICQQERPTGTHIARQVCRSPEQLDDEEAARRTWMNRSPANPLIGDHTYPGIDLRHPRP